MGLATFLREKQAAAEANPITDIKSAAEELMAKLKELTASFEQDNKEMDEELRQIKERGRKARYLARLQKSTADQPAGTPVPIFEKGLELVFARDYCAPRAGRKPRRALRESDFQPPPEVMQAAEKAKSLPPEEKAKLERVWDEWLDSLPKAEFHERNHWWSERLQAYVAITENCATGKVKAQVLRDVEPNLKSALYINTYIAAEAYNLRHEMRALKKLKGHVTKSQFERWLLTGMLLEQSKKSKVCYIFRRLRPTLAFRHDPEKNEYKFLAALCHHTVAYYKVSWAGALVPTDDLLSHLLFMRADEHGFWKRSSQHQRDAAQADY